MRSAVAYSPPWELRRRGLKDSLRHDARVKEALRKNLREIISEESIISSDGTRRVRIPLRYLDQYRFKVGQPPQGVGQGDGTKGDILWHPVQGAPRDGQPGDQPGEHTYEAEIDLNTLTHMMLEDLALPWLEAKPAGTLPEDTYQFTDLRKRGPWSHLDKRRTLKNNIQRNALHGSRGVHDLTLDDCRFRVWDVDQALRTNAAVYMLMDISGSMTTDKKYIAKCFFFWLVQFIRLKYPHVELVFIAHDTEAEVVTEQTFFGHGAGGGTRCSSAYHVAAQHLDLHHPAARWCTYLFHFSDGDNLPEDNPVCQAWIEHLLHACTMCGYGEILWAETSLLVESTLLQTCKTIVHPHFMTARLRSREDVHAALKQFLATDLVAA